MKVKKLHNWNLSYSQARELQSRLAGRVQIKTFSKNSRLVAGLDCAFTKDGKRIVAGAVVLELPGLEIIETKSATRKVAFPYIPGLLSFREAPVCIAAVKKLRCKPDVFLIDGQGIAHPRRLGLAAHLGLFFDSPTIGCAKSRLTGVFEEPAQAKGGYSGLTNAGETIGVVLRTRTNVKPLFISIGNRCTLKDAIKIVLACTTKYRLPEPTRLAHQFVSKIRLEV